MATRENPLIALRCKILNIFSGIQSLGRKISQVTQFTA